MTKSSLSFGIRPPCSYASHAGRSVVTSTPAGSIAPPAIHASKFKRADRVLARWERTRSSIIERVARLFWLPAPPPDRDGRALSLSPRRGRMYARRGRALRRVRAAGYTGASYSMQAGREPADSCRPHTPSAARRISPASRPRNYQRSRRLGDCSRGSKPQSNGLRSLACWRGPSAGRVRILMVCICRPQRRHRP